MLERTQALRRAGRDLSADDVRRSWRWMCWAMPTDHPDRVEAQRQFDNLMVDDGERFFFQPCFSPVWDTAIAALCAGRSGLAPQRALRRCGRLAADARKCAARATGR